MEAHVAAHLTRQSQLRLAARAHFPMEGLEPLGDTQLVLCSPPSHKARCAQHMCTLCAPNGRANFRLHTKAAQQLALAAPDHAALLRLDALVVVGAIALPTMARKRRSDECGVARLRGLKLQRVVKQRSRHHLRLRPFFLLIVTLRLNRHRCPLLSASFFVRASGGTHAFGLRLCAHEGVMPACEASPARRGEEKVGPGCRTLEVPSYRLWTNLPSLLRRPRP
mmetsp:Transcript_24904/g.50014  ORF Transcript_24904/g.50014 Transcript_24904/m.50014 type:complete len:223 (+) Transcript_24904:296-964(+)